MMSGVDKKQKRLVLSILMIFIFCTIGIVLGNGKNRSKPKDKPNIILIIIDTLRADHLGCYGYERNASPNIDRFAQQGTIFANAFSQAGYTLAAYASILTGRLPLSHGVIEGIDSRNLDKLSKSEVTLAEALKENQYVTAAFTGGGFTSRKFGFAQGFDIYEEIHRNKFDKIYKNDDIKYINEKVFRWLEKNKDSNFFLLVHTFNVHEPFNPPDAYKQIFSHDYQGFLEDEFIDDELVGKITKKEIPTTQEDINFIISQYDGDIRYCDMHIGRLLNKIEQLGLASNSIIILTADHGEDLMDHKTIGHRDVYDVGIQIPLIIRFPSFPFEQRIVNSIVRSIDIFPTILDVLNLPKENRIEGYSFLPLIMGKNEREREVFSFGWKRLWEHENETVWRRKRFSIRTNRWKYIATPDILAYELYYLWEDPKELKNLAYKEKKRLAFFNRRLINYFENSEISRNAPSKAILDSDLKKNLRSLGYLH